MNSVAHNPGGEDTESVRSELLGELRIRPIDCILFPSGVLGFPECRQFALLRGERDGLFWLQSMEHSALTFLLVDPFTVDTAYSFDVQPTQIGDLGPATASDIGLLAVVTLPANPTDAATANLQGPIVINFSSRRARQLVAGDDQYGVRYEFDLARLVG